jgi:hypothetical protein
MRRLLLQRDRVFAGQNMGHLMNFALLRTYTKVSAMAASTTDEQRSSAFIRNSALHWGGFSSAEHWLQLFSKKNES